METLPPITGERLNDYLRSRILPTLGEQGRPFSLEPVKSGSRNTVWFLNVERGGRYVLKAVSKRFRIKNIIRAHAYLESRDVPVPRLLFADKARKTAKFLGCYVACEERVEGTPLDRLGDRRKDHLPQAAALFARMHGTRSLRWGKIKSFQILGFRSYFIRKAAERIEALGASGCTVGGRPAAELLPWFAKKSGAIRPLMRFSLCHGDVNMNNILLCPGGGIRLIDTEAFKFLPFQIEFFRLAYFLCGLEDEQVKIFQNAYLAAAPRANRLALERCPDPFRAYVLLEFAWHCNKKLKQEALPGDARAAFTATRGRALDRLAALLSEDR